MTSNNVVHLTSAHQRYDTRIFIKMCSSLAARGYRVSLVVADGKGAEMLHNVAFYDVGAKSVNRVIRMTDTVSRVYRKAKELDADIYHLHDPELIPIGLKLKRMGKKVIFDAHEDFPKQLLGKPYLIKPLKLVLSKFFGVCERIALPKFDAIVCATPFIRDKMLSINPNSVDINNYPLLDELTCSSGWSDKKNEVAYVGSISKIRGVWEVVSALSYTRGVRLNLAGKFSQATFEAEVKGLQAWGEVTELGFLTREQVKKTLANSKAGLVTLHPAINYLDSLPVKMFEYMAASLPVIASNFPLWSEIVESNGCGVCVDPLSPQDIGEAMQYIVDNPKEALLMGERGRKAVEDKYNWGIEEIKLIQLYSAFSR